MTAKTTRNARSRTQRGLARAAMEIQRKKVKLQEDHLTALFTHLDGIDQQRLGAGAQVAKLRELGLTLGEIAELTGEPVNRLSWLSRLTAEEDKNDPEGEGGIGGEEASHGGALVDDEDPDPVEEGTGENQDNAPSSSRASETETAGGRLQA